MRAGIKAVVTEAFEILQEQKGISLDKTLVYCMTPEIYESDRLIQFGEPMITSFNKHFCVDHEKYPEIKEGGNAILLGDIVEDYLIVKNLKMKNVIGIGFLNVIGECSKEVIDRYSKVFDVIILHDGNITHAVEIIKSIIGVPMDADYIKKSSITTELIEILKP